MGKDWFDEETGLLTFDEQVVASPSYRAIMDDGVVTDEEIRGQSERVLQALQEAQASLAPAQGELVGRLLVDMSILHAVMQYREIADLRRSINL